MSKGRIEGPLTKKSKSKLSQLVDSKMFLTRYFLIDFETAKVVIQKSLYERKDYKVIEFGDINSVEQ